LLSRLKDCDVTWLYGPLQTHSKNAISGAVSPPPSRLSAPFLHKKPILKKSFFFIGTTPPESVVNTPAGEPQPTLSRDGFATPSGLQSPGERRHIHFNDEVVQCIAVESKDDDDEEEEEEQPPAVISDEEDEDEDEGLFMKQVPSKARTSNMSTPRGSFSAESKTIAPLPSTTLKYRSDTPEPPEAEQQQYKANINLSPSPFQETLRPARPNANFLIDDDEEYPDLQWQPSSSCPGPGMRRTPSGMFMPHDQDEAALERTLFGRVVDTANTARDIAHVIWNVRWRR
jgi:hypothetical protein